MSRNPPGAALNAPRKSSPASAPGRRGENGGAARYSDRTVVHVTGRALSSGTSATTMSWVDR